MTEGGGTKKGPIKFYTAIIAFFLSFFLFKKIFIVISLHFLNITFYLHKHSLFEWCLWFQMLAQTLLVDM